ncbi:TauD/TfdA family dioxygenase (plasmid) [Bradyrhizobium sp. 155]|uniref:TauD/TfdA family dioxygenase n=1 Tax=unclassified Bradyrhizobium TaxID=2631580 RepID=UPI001FFA8071|nr:TauD/TfdA family dioxygenase [Bradyrhizobium sp. 155]MCK1326773.1 TauD/TfdA family dioxygenase [Bradyrhizobium sp. 156]UPK15939.1 TauD/TfdA family dioxygenase [Bradyrhizobium sp. 155]
MTGEPATHACVGNFSQGLLWDALISTRPEVWRFKIPLPLLDPAPLANVSDSNWPAIVHSDLVLDTEDAHAGFFRRVEQALAQGPGFALLSRIPVEKLSFREARFLHIILAKRFGRLRPQDVSGSYLCDVVDPDMSSHMHGHGQIELGRRWNNLPCHTDHAFGRDPPRRLAFLCFEAAEVGGAVRLASAAALLARVAAIGADLVEDLRRPVPFDATRQIDPADDAIDAVSIVSSDTDGTRLRYLYHQIAHASLDPRQREAVGALETALVEPGLVAELLLSPGDVLLIDNGVVLHGRGPYRNRQVPRAPRHHLRLWLI